MNRVNEAFEAFFHSVKFTRVGKRIKVNNSEKEKGLMLQAFIAGTQFTCKGSKPIWAIYADIVCDYYGDEKEECVATFDTKEAAEKYEEKSRLKRTRWNKLYRDKSQLCGYKCADIRLFEKYDDEPPHNPEVDWKTA